MLKQILKSFYHKHYRFQKFKILGRTACLGNEIIKQMKWNKNYINHQKSRVDYLIELNENKKISPNPKEILKFLKHKFIIGTIEHQRYDFFRYAKPDIIVIDSFSELTDQLFLNQKDNSVFCANYTDIDHSLLPEYYECKGLLEQNLYEIYDNFFEKVNLVYPNTPLYFIHFSTVLDNRDKFKLRGGMIVEIIEQLAKKYNFIKSIVIDDTLINRASSDSEEFNSLPYHYDEDTYQNYILEFKKIYYNGS